MDSITHIALGACIGELVAGKQLRKKALWYGALAQSVPDIDFVAGFFLHGAENVTAHRGITHSLLFGALATVLLSLALRYGVAKTALSVRRLMVLIGFNILAHLFLDTCNAYGVSLLAPFTDFRFTFHLLFVADPLFSLAPIVSFLFLVVLNESHRRRVMWVRTGLGVSAIYLCLAFLNKQVVTQTLEAQLISEQKGAEFFTTPSPFNTLLWYAVVKEKDGYYTTYRSVFDTGPSPLHFTPRNDALAANTSNQNDLRLLQKFSQGYYTLEQRGDTTLFNVLRFGQVVGWYDPTEKFSFHYYLNRPGENDLVVQRGRFMRWNRQTTAAFFKRMMGGK